MTTEQELRQRLETDTEFYARKLVKIINKREKLVPLAPKPGQIKLEQAIRQQEAEGKPVRIIVLKARRAGISTWVQCRMIKRITQRPNHKALVVAHDKETAENLFAIGETMYSYLPDRFVDGLHLKPPSRGTRKGQRLELGEPSRVEQLKGNRGLNSEYRVDSANSYEFGRGFEFNSLHASECAFWEQGERKLRALLNTVSDEPGSMVILESTPNGYNLFRTLWVAAEQRRSDYYPFFLPWFDEPEYTRQFPDEEARERFIDAIGTGPWGGDEPHLVEEHGVTPEQLHWRRWAIENLCHGDIRSLWQEFPASASEAFLSAGKQVFSPVLISKVLDRAEQTDPEAEQGLIKPERWRTEERRGRQIEIPETPLWTPAADISDLGVGTRWWKVWAHPDPGDEEAGRPPGQYVLAVDSASGKETESGEEDYFAIQMIDHRTREQVAEWHERRIDPDLVAVEVYMAALYYRRAWVGVEMTGGYGLSIANYLYRTCRYGKIYFRRPAERKNEKMDKRLGWSTDAATKPLLVDTARELLRTGRDGIRSLTLAGEAQTYVRDPKNGKMGAEEDYHDDSLEAWMMAQAIAAEKPILRERSEDTAPRPSRLAPSMRRRPRQVHKPRGVKL